MTSEKIRKKLQHLIINFEKELKSDELRTKVCALIPCFHQLRELGKSLIPKDTARSARDRILHYFLKYPKIIIRGDELLVVSGIQEYARRVRELKVQFGWSVISGVTANQMEKENEFLLENIDISSMGPSDYIMLSSKQDRDAAHRWHLANEMMIHFTDSQYPSQHVLAGDILSPATTVQVADMIHDFIRRHRK